MSWRSIWGFVGGFGMILSLACGQISGLMGCLCVIVLACLMPKAA